MPTFLSGLPLHPLIVHAVVVLVPVAVLGAITVAVWPAARRRWGIPVAVVTALAAASVPLATSTGEGLEHNLPRTPAISVHAELGDQLLVFLAPLLVAVVALVALERWPARSGAHALATSRTEGPGGMVAPARRTPPRALMASIGVLTVVLATVSAVQVVRIGDTGARAAWGDVHYAPQPRPARPDGD